MRISHRVSVASSPAVRAELAAAGIEVPAEGFVTVTVAEDEPGWPAVAALVARTGAVDVVSTAFTRRELAAAAWLQLVPDWHHGYPQPQDSYRAAVYDLTEFCAACGIGGRQVAPFRMKGEPAWGRRGILQLHWVFGEFFVTPAAAAEVFAPLGAGTGPVLDRRGAAELTTVRQLRVEAVADVDVAGLDPSRCADCGRVKYAPSVAGPSPRPVDPPPGAPLLHSAQWFGSGAEAHRLVLVPQATAAAIAARKLRGASVRPAGA